MWGRVVPELAALNLLKESDLGVLTSFCVAWDQLMQAVTAYRERDERPQPTGDGASCRGRGPGRDEGRFGARARIGVHAKR